MNKIENGKDKKLDYYNSPSKGRRDFFQVLADIVGFIAEEPLERYSIVVGTDSSLISLYDMTDGNGFDSSTKFRTGKLTTSGSFKKETTGNSNFVSVITVHRVGHHGRYFWKKMSGIKTFDRHDRMLKEAYFSIEIAHRLVGELRERLNGHFYDFEIHLDIGHNGPTKDMIQEIVGMVTGNGFTAKIKPYSYAANKVADRYV